MYDHGITLDEKNKAINTISKLVKELNKLNSRLIQLDFEGVDEDKTYYLNKSESVDFASDVSEIKIELRKLITQLNMPSLQFK